MFDHILTNYCILLGCICYSCVVIVSGTAAFTPG